MHRHRSFPQINKDNIGLICGLNQWWCLQIRSYMSKNSAFMQAIDEICEEKGLKKEIVIEAVEAAIAAAYRKDYGKSKQIMRATLNPVTGEAEVYRVYEIVETEQEVEENERQLTLVEATKLNKKAVIGGEIIIPQPKEEEFGRIAAQTAKQVVIQRIREAEREMLLEEYKDKEGMVLSASVQQIDGHNIIVSLGKANGILYPSEQVRNERYYVGQRLKIFVREVGENSRGPQIIVSRTDEGLISGLFANEVPEITSGSVEIKNISREPGSRTKIAVIANEDGIDPVGSCVGQRGTRVQAILNEIGEEKIDIVLWDEDVEQFIMNALSPAKTEDISISSKDHKAAVKVNKENLSLAIGKGGQNVRLASKLTGWGIDIVESDQSIANDIAPDHDDKTATSQTSDKPIQSGNLAPKKSAKNKKPSTSKKSVK